jgi:hypothetical protein
MLSRPWVVGAFVMPIVFGLTACSSSGADHGSATTTTVPTNVHFNGGSAGRVVSYHGVQVQVPSAWPVRDGDFTGQCAGPFFNPPSAFVGPNNNPPPGCPAPTPKQMATRYDGVWLHQSPKPESGYRTTTTPGGTTMLAFALYPSYPIKTFWLHGVEVDVGLGADARTAQTIIESIRFASGAPDSRVATAKG